MPGRKGGSRLMRRSMASCLWGRQPSRLSTHTGADETSAAHRQDACATGLLFRGGGLEDEMYWVLRMNALVQLRLQGCFRFGKNSTIRGFLPRQIGKGCELALEVSGGNAIPETVFESQDVDLLLFDAENRRVRQADENFVGPQIHSDVMLQIEARFCAESSVEFHALGAAC